MSDKNKKTPLKSILDTISESGSAAKLPVAEVKVQPTTKRVKANRNQIIESRVAAKRLEVSQQVIKNTQKFFDELSSKIKSVFGNDKDGEAYAKWFKAKSIDLLSITASNKNVDSIPTTIAQYLIKAYSFIIEVEMNAKANGLDLEISKEVNLFLELVKSLPKGVTKNIIQQAAAGIQHLVAAQTNLEAVIGNSLKQVNVDNRMLTISEYRKLITAELDEADKVEAEEAANVKAKAAEKAKKEAEDKAAAEAKKLEEAKAVEEAGKKPGEKKDENKKTTVDKKRQPKTRKATRSKTSKTK